MKRYLIPITESPADHAPCTASPIYFDREITDHPLITGGGKRANVRFRNLRDQRKVAGMLAQCGKTGITHFIETMWEITKD